MSESKEVNIDETNSAEIEATGMLSWLWITALVVGLDYVSKSMATDALALYQSITIFPFFNFTLLHNTGAAFSFLSDAGGWQRWAFSVIAIGTSIGLMVWLWKLPKSDKWLAIALALIIGGAIGNVYDRLAYGYVVDFLDFHWAGIHFPAFNIADTGISIGAMMMGIDMIRHPNK